MRLRQPLASPHAKHEHFTIYIRTCQEFFSKNIKTIFDKRQFYACFCINCTINRLKQTITAAFKGKIYSFFIKILYDCTNYANLFFEKFLPYLYIVLYMQFPVCQDFSLNNITRKHQFTKSSHFFFQIVKKQVAEALFCHLIFLVKSKFLTPYFDRSTH